jgi:hypothetical protein
MLLLVTKQNNCWRWVNEGVFGSFGWVGGNITQNSQVLEHGPGVECKFSSRLVRLAVVRCWWCLTLWFACLYAWGLLVFYDTVLQWWLFCSGHNDMLFCVSRCAYFVRRENYCNLKRGRLLSGNLLEKTLWWHSKRLILVSRYSLVNSSRVHSN